MGNRVATKKFTLTTDAAGDATETTSFAINGEVLAVQVEYAGTAPATTDLTLTSSAPSDTILSLANANTDNVFYPRNIVHDNTGVAAVGGDNLFTPFIVQGTLTCTIAQGGNALTHTVTVFWRKI